MNLGLKLNETKFDESLYVSWKKMLKNSLLFKIINFLFSYGDLKAFVNVNCLLNVTIYIKPVKAVQKWPFQLYLKVPLLLKLKSQIRFNNWH